MVLLIEILKQNRNIKLPHKARVFKGGKIKSLVISQGM